MLNIFTLFLKNPFCTNLANRLVNRFTAHGITILLLQLENMGILGAGTTEKIDGLPNISIIGWVVISLGAYFVWHAHPRSKLEKIQEKIDIYRAKRELQNLQEKGITPPRGKVKRDIAEEKN